MIIEVARKVILRLNVEEKDIVERLYPYDGVRMEWKLQEANFLIARPHK